MVISFMDYNMFYSFGYVILRYKMVVKSLKVRLKGLVFGLV